MKRIWVLLLLTLTFTACSDEEEQKTSPAASERLEETLIENLQSPWDIEKSEEAFFISERSGAIVSWDGQELNREKVETNRAITQIGEGGLLGLKLFPDFPESGKAYTYHTYKENGDIYNRLIVIQRADGVWMEEEVLLEQIPGANFHNGGRVEIGPDNKLYITTGDGLVERSAQDKGNLAGKILRMNLDGTIPSDNPFEDSYVYSYGHRNPQGLAWRDDGTLFASEHGPDAHDEINIIEPGNNYGWPEIKGDQQKDGIEPPFFHTGKTTWAPSGVAFQANTLVIATLRGSALQALKTNDRSTDVITDTYGRIRDTEMIDGELYFITNNTDGRGNPIETDDRLIQIDQTD